MTTITIDQAVLHRALSALEYHTQQTRPIHNTELVIEELRAALAAQQSVPSWQDSPTDPGMWVSSSNGACSAWNISQELIGRDYWTMTGMRWFGPIPTEEDTK